MSYDLILPDATCRNGICPFPKSHGSWAIAKAAPSTTHSSGGPVRRQNRFIPKVPSCHFHWRAQAEQPPRSGYRHESVDGDRWREREGLAKAPKAEKLVCRHCPEGNPGYRYRQLRYALV